MNNFAKWLMGVAPGTKEEFPEFIYISHKDGDGSHLFRRARNDDVKSLPESIRYIYEQYNGIDLFDSTFQIASFSNDVILKGEKVIGSLQDLREKIGNLEFPEKCVPFMLEGTEWVYAASLESPHIYCYDFQCDVFDTYDSVEEIVEGWIEETAND